MAKNKGKKRIIVVVKMKSGEENFFRFSERINAESFMKEIKKWETVKEAIITI